MSEEKEKALAQKLNDSFKDMVGKVFGDKGKEFIETIQKQTKEISGTAIKSFVDFTDKILESTKLKDKEIVKKSSDNVKDLLKQLGFLNTAK
jgi:polyhydroxyalkanoate synthesis regulator phasin